MFTGVAPHAAPHGGDRGAEADRDGPIVIASVPASARQRRIAFGALVVLVAFIALTIPFASIALAQVEPFVPVIQTVICLADLLTATLLFAEYSVYPRRAVLVLASGYIFSGLFAFLQTLAFPGGYTERPLIGDELNTAGWLFVFWHAAFLLAVIVYVMLKDVGEAASLPGLPAGVTIGVTIACVLAATAGLTLVATEGVGYLPRLFLNVTNMTSAANDAKVALAVLNVVALVLLFVRRRTVLDYWLIVVLVAWLPNFVVSILITMGRFTVGWYSTRIFALCAGSSLLLALLIETVVMYTRVANALAHQKLLVAELDHRVKNALVRVAAIVTETRESSYSMDDFVKRLGGRLQSMAAAHSMLSKGRWHGVGIADLIRDQLAPHVIGTNVTIHGPNVILSAATTQALAMVVHELATNAVKFGALSRPGGRVTINWDAPPGDRAATFTVEWRETGGPPVAKPTQAGFGTSLITELISHELGGSADLAFDPDGVRCRIAFPRSHSIEN
jgi:two-component sensor histidine kinase